MTLIRDAIDTILPHNCLVCGKFPDADGRIPYAVPEGFHICFDCLSKVVPQTPDQRFFTCLSEPYKGDPYPQLPLYMPFPYKGFFETAVPRMKFHSCPELAEFSGALLGSLMVKDGIAADLMVPIPLSSGRLKERGYNQAELISKGASLVCNIPSVSGVLTRIKDTERQTEITDNAQRSLNVHGAFKTSKDYDIARLRVILIDDVATTGNTLHEAACALYEAGAAQVLCCALCGNRAVLNKESY